MATHSSVLAWKIPGMGEPSGLPPMGSHRVGHDWSDLAAERKLHRSILLITKVAKAKNSQFSSVQSLNRVRLFATPWTAVCQASLSITTPGVYSSSCPSSWWCHPTVSSSVIPFSSRLQSFPTSGSFQMSQLFTSGGQSIGVSASTSVLPMNIQGWFSLGWTGWISLLSKGLSRVFSSTTVQKHQFFGAQLSL